MNSNYLKFLLVVLTLSVGFIACNKSSENLEEMVPKEEIPAENLSSLDVEEPEFEPELIATIQKDGHVITFETLGDPRDGAIMVSERLYGEAFQNDEVFLTERDSDDWSPLDLFLEITNDRTAVPKRLAAKSTNPDTELGGRVVLSDNTPVKLLDVNFAEPIGERNCYNKDIGDYDFRHQVCYRPSSSICSSGSRWISQCGYDRNRGNKIFHSICGGWKTPYFVQTRVLSVCATTRTTLWGKNPSTGISKILSTRYSYKNQGVVVRSFWPGKRQITVVNYKTNGSGFYRASMYARY